MLAEGITIALCETSPAEEAYLAEKLRQFLPEATLLFTDGVLTSETPLPGREWADASVLSTFIHSRISRGVLERMPALRGIATRSTGYDHIDLAACAERGITVTHVPHYGENTVAEHTFALILSLSRNVHRAYLRTSGGDFSLAGLQGFDLKGKTLGVVGVGSIGLHVIRIARAFGMRVLATDTHPNRMLAEVLDFTYADLDDVLAGSDIVSLHAPARPSTYHLMNRQRLQQMKHGALLINTARGSLVDTEALLWALDSGILAGAGLDVLEGEELIAEELALLSHEEHPATQEELRMALGANLLLRRPDVVITPHIGFNSREALERILDTTVANIVSQVAQRPQNAVHM